MNRKPPEAVRSVPVQVTLRPGEAAALDAVRGYDTRSDYLRDLLLRAINPKVAP